MVQILETSQSKKLKQHSDTPEQNKAYTLVQQCFRVGVGQGPDLDKTASKFPQVFNNKKNPTMARGYYVIDLEDGAVPFNKGSSRTMREPCMEKLKAEFNLQLSM